MGWQGWCGVGASVCLTGYQIPALVRMYRRKSSQDYSIPAYLLVITGLTLYAGATAGSPAFLPSLVSLGNSVFMLAAILWYRRNARPLARPQEPQTPTPSGRSSRPR